MSHRNNSPTVASVTVATNAAGSLPRQLDALLRQSHPLSEIVVVDNASSDGTRELLASNYPQVTVLALSTNTGVGGGFSAGMAYATKKHQWVWILDDDSIPEDDALAVLLQGLHWLKENDDVGLLAPMPVHADSAIAYGGVVWNHGFKTTDPQISQQPAWFVDVVISSGSLIRQDVVRAIGLPRSDFFMDFVDFEYCLRMRRNNFKVALVRDSRLHHAIGKPRVIKFLGFSRAWTEQPAWREYYLARNYTYTVWKYYDDWRTKLLTLKWLARHAIGVTLLSSDRLHCLKMMVCGFVDGRAGRLGIRFRPHQSSRNALEARETLVVH